ncbi:siroheme synthase CysG [Alteromonas sp. a30]|uniref:siroheme synthase CysG n=1 Tax=Alteromonas sp. a30 TaxID=2730917 RepID=UPI0022824B6A|nr:siroheme synthase CysG [Alteromonas sp. a30]MCY7294841.1 uroporphyrinogen-III C-methyltransferase [Alteromonas sp. a30]
MRYFPIFVDTQDQDCLVVGAGEVAARKIELLLKTEARIHVIAPDACNTVLQYAQQGRIQFEQRRFQDKDVSTQTLIFVATDNNHLNAHIHQIARDKGIMVNVVDNTPLCRFITPAIVDRSPIVVALSSGGSAPVLLRYIRQKLETVLPHSISKLGTLFQRFRDRVKAAFSDVDARRAFWEEVMEGDVAEHIYNNQETKAETALIQRLTQVESQTAEEGAKKGAVYLIGAGPGDPELLTFKALRLMQKADVVVYDRLVSKDILEMVRRDAEKVYVGKAKSNHTLPQGEINQLLVERALAGQRVVRLKGGDPFIFGRGGEEIETLFQYNIDFQVVPGITAATGAASYSGIPLTHRDHAQSVVFATGHLKEDTIDLDWPALVQKGQTLVFYMGLTGLPIICKQLVQHGMPKDMPIALVQSATCEQQRVVTGTLTDIVAKAEQEALKPPTLIIVGSVVSLHDKLKWF